MHSIAIDPRVFEHVPSYSRCVFTVQVPDTASAPEMVAEALRHHADLVGSCRYVDDRIAEWEEIFQAVRINPNRYPPSLKSLVKRCRSGKGLPYVNDLVAIMNLASLLLRQPCGADDLDKVGDELMLRPADGDEAFVPLGAADVVENPDPGEIVYVDNTNKNVLCRRFIWRNGHLSRLTEHTSKLAFNVDIASGNSFLVTEARVLIPRLFWDFMRAEVNYHLLNIQHSRVEIDI
ncbi:MAG: B3/4 domain-containing protein [Hyphomicrobiales bacterium]